MPGRSSYCTYRTVASNIELHACPTMPVRAISVASVSRSSSDSAWNASTTVGCAAGDCTCTTNRMSATASGPNGSGPTASGHRDTRKRS
eukprot:scaffold113031_cov46-Phaeocystis_antarctica.AAC.2